MDRKILIVEDEFVVANALRLILEQAGYNVHGIASSFEEADEMLHRQKPDLVLLDIQLKGKLSGIDFAKKLRAQNIAFIYLSANSSQKILEEAKKTEPYGFLVKPFREKDLLIALDIASYRHKNSLESQLRREELLQKQLEEISNENSNTEQKLVKLAREMQSYVPFDFIAAVFTATNEDPTTAFGYLRTGFDEYQFIGEKESITITGAENNVLGLMAKKSHEISVADIYETEMTDGHSHSHPIQKTLLDSFKIVSYLVFPVRLNDGSFVHYFFCSRKHHFYNQNHITLLNHVKTDLAAIMANKATLPSGTSEAKKRYGEKNIPPQFKNIIGNHPLLLAALDLTTQVAPYNTSVLILGESGTGKEKVAECIHRLSARKDAPFIKVNCAALPPSLMESELFGYEKGAFTGAAEKRKGKFELADKGTIFLDEIGELPLEMQVKLLRVLQEKEIDPIGSSASKKIDVRIVAATNRNLEKEAAEGNFRLDLYYRLNVFPITLPPLRERKSDITLLVSYFADKFSKEFGKGFLGIGIKMVQEMNTYDWPGNIRELENVMERSVILNDGKSELELKQSLTAVNPELPDNKTAIASLEDVKNMQRKTEREYIISILKKTNGRIRGNDGAAAILDIKPTTLESKMIKLGIKKEDF